MTAAQKWRIPGRDILRLLYRLARQLIPQQIITLRLGDIKMRVFRNLAPLRGKRAACSVGKVQINTALRQTLPMRQNRNLLQFRIVEVGHFPVKLFHIIGGIASGIRCPAVLSGPILTVQIPVKTVHLLGNRTAVRLSCILAWCVCRTAAYLVCHNLFSSLLLFPQSQLTNPAALSTAYTVYNESMSTDFNPLPPEWMPGLDALRRLPDGGTALLIGGTDRGKTTFTTLVVRLLAGEFERVAIIDADIGQSEIGPPGTVGVAWATRDAAKLYDLKPAAVFFVGAFAPVAVALEQVVAVSQAVQWAKARGAQRILIDTTGFISGPAARRLKAAKAQASQPRLVIGIARDSELDGLVAVTGAVSGAETLLLPVPEAVGRKSSSLRQTRRLARLSQALLKSREVTLSLSQVSTVGATLGTGEKIPTHLVQWAGNALRLPAVYAEKAEGTLTLFCKGPQARSGWEAGATPVAEHFGARTVRALSLDSYANTYVGLHDASGRLLCVGRFLHLDPERDEITVSAPLPSTTAAERFRLITFGRVRVGADGAFLSDIKPGEI